METCQVYYGINSLHVWHKVKDPKYAQRTILDCLPWLSKMNAFLQGFAAGEFSARCLHVHHLVDDWVVHGRGLGQQCWDDRDWDRHRVWLSERRYHRYHCIRNPGDQEACTDQHRHLGWDKSPVCPPQCSPSPYFSHSTFHLTFTLSTHLCEFDF